MAELTKCFPIFEKDYIRAGEASIQVQNLLKSINVDPRLIRRVAICGYEGEMNVVMHGGEGKLCLQIDNRQIVLEISDNGPGIADVELALQEGYSTATDEQREMGFGAGMGLPNMKRNADHLDIETRQSRGTRVRMVFHFPAEEA
jgi:anti-sigma regulatory factor (Ser/Thr protein kinase)